VRRAAAGRRADIEELAPVLLDRVFITHLHSDHTAGYADLILTPWAVGRRQPLLVHGPRGTQRMTDHIVAAYREDLEVRSRGEADGYGVVVHEVEPGVVYEDESVRVTAFPVRHGTWEHAYGYAFEAPDRTVVVSGDTAPADSVVEACDGCDVLVHEVYSEAGLLRGPADWRSYHRAFHTSSVELGKLASRAEPELLVLTHQLYWGTTDEELVAEVRAHFDGPVVSGADLDVY
jgi:ribonuclease BN (tRNA processing enzyme)